MTDKESPRPGCFTLRPASYALWKNICHFLEPKLQLLGTRDFAFPFPTSEMARTEGDLVSALGPHFSRWIRNHENLPLLLNQYTSLSQGSSPAPFLQRCQYLMQQAYSAHLTQEGAYKEREEVLNMYSALYEELLAVPVITGYRRVCNRETNRMRTANLSNTPSSHSMPIRDTTDSLSTVFVLGYLPTLNQWTEAASCYELGQSLSKEHNITVPFPPALSHEETTKDPVHVWQNSWALTTRSLGLMVLTHADNRGLIFPPRIAPLQVLLVPIEFGLSSEDRQLLHAEISTIMSLLVQRGVRAEMDLRGWRSHAWKWNEAAVKGVPVLLALGIDGLRDKTAMVYRRDTKKGEGGTKSVVKIEDLAIEIPRLLDVIQTALFWAARERVFPKIRRVEAWDEFLHGISSDDVDEFASAGCLAPHCLYEECEVEIEALLTGMPRSSTISILCIPRDQPEKVQEKRCINPNCENSPKKWVMFGRE